MRVAFVKLSFELIANEVDLTDPRVELFDLVAQTQFIIASIIVVLFDLTFLFLHKPVVFLAAPVQHFLRILRSFDFGFEIPNCLQGVALLLLTNTVDGVSQLLFKR